MPFDNNISTDFICSS